LTSVTITATVLAGFAPTSSGSRKNES